MNISICEALMWLDAGTPTNPRYIRVEYTLVPGYFFVRSITDSKGMRRMAVRDSQSKRFASCPTRTDSDFFEWLKGRKMSKASPSDAKP
jgi:hypothetical protein